MRTGRRRPRSEYNEGMIPSAIPPKSDVTYGGEYDENGVDVSLIRYMLSLSPLERLVKMTEASRDAYWLYECGRRHRDHPSSKTL
jgi:hypothetical protein